jgi:beta-galactosidase
MAEFVAKGGQFWLDDQPQLIQAGEFHYFRTPPEYWAHRLSLLQTAGFNALATYIPWLWHQLAEGQTDLDGHSHPMRNLQGFLDLAAEMGFWIIPRPGPYIMAETINEGIPRWVLSRYPQVAFVSRGNQVQNIVSYMHPDFLARVTDWYRAVFAVLTPRQITRGGKIIMIQLDNEMGMMHWVRNIMDANPDTIARFAAHLRSRYGERLADRYPTDATRLEGLLREGILNPQGPHAGKIVEDYRVFYRDYLREYASFLWAEAKACGLEVPPIINIHGFMNGGKTFPIGLSQLIEVLRMDGVLSATDVYPGVIGEGTYHQLLLVNEMTKALQYKEQALFSVEFQSGGTGDFSNSQSSLYDLHTRLCISQGMRAINHYLFCSGENDPILSPVKRHDWGPPVRKDGTLRKHYFRYPKLSRVLAAYGADLILSRPETVTTIGFILDYFMTEVNNEFTQEHTRLLTHQREVVLFDMLARSLALTHRPFSAIDLDRVELDVSQMPLCWVMVEKQCAAETQRKLVEYLHQGGKLVLAGRMCVEDFSQQPCTVLQEALGIDTISSDPPFVLSAIRAFDYEDVPVSFVETYTGQFDEVFATRNDGEVVGFVKTVGKGKAMMFGAAMTVNHLDDLDIVHRMALKMDCPPAFKLSNWADVRLSRGENGSFLFINNYQDDPVEATIKHHDHALLGGHPVHIPARQGLILPIDWRPKEGVIVNYVTAEIVGVADDGPEITLKTSQESFTAELTLSGYRCDHAISIQDFGQTQRIKVHSNTGKIVLRAHSH